MYSITNPVLHALHSNSKSHTWLRWLLSPCSFCGRLGLPTCSPMIRLTSGRIRTEINCPRAETFQYGSATKGSDNRPCRNVPIACKLCTQRGRDTEWQPAVWHYNIEAHIDSHHPEYAHPGKPVGLPLPYNVYLSLEISELEERRFGVQHRPPFTLIAPGTAFNENNPPAAAQLRGQKRATHFSKAVHSAGAKRARRCPS
ncbi:hypothetical protein PAXRUDRAFT_141750 [Paxillus rubicundulus Ve08.2h10]|uniref:Uncharacterized protein n=1 Tax=Paxillus rubicundulus Ve08.2h10 TaxID=930991 RepID=A0A0D0DXV9_9AGAM|nr:hypothetical protein PAXRUDRAFT_141750 [Paxillus rubicundulus Ve08.2h10]